MRRLGSQGPRSFIDIDVGIILVLEGDGIPIAGNMDDVDGKITRRISSQHAPQLTNLIERQKGRGGGGKK